MFEEFQKFMTAAAARYGVSKEIKAAKLCHDFKTLIPEFFKDHPRAQLNISPAYFKQNVLVINVKNQAWAQEVIIRKHKIIEEMNRISGEQIIKNLRTQLQN